MILDALTQRSSLDVGYSNELDPKANIDKLLFIDALRGLAAVYVIICHVKFMPIPHLKTTAIAANIALSGHTGVKLFFMISAFTLCLSSRKRKTSLGMAQTREFYLRRFFRILPLYVFSVFLSWFRDFILYGYARPWMDTLSASISIFQPGNFTGLVWASWTLSIELTFYLLFPFIFKLCSTFKRTFILLAVSIFADLIYVKSVTSAIPEPLIFVNINAHDPSQLLDNYIRFGFFHNFQFFILGIIFFYIYFAIKDISSKFTGISAIFIGIIGFFALVLFYPSCLYSVWHGKDSLPAAFFLIFVVGISLYPTKLLVNRLTVYMGTISYSLYLLHPFIVVFLSPFYSQLYKLNWHSDLSYALCLATTLMLLVPLAILTYNFIETPGIKLGGKIIKSMSSKILY